MSIDLKEMSSKLAKLDELLDKLDSKIKDNNPAAELPTAEGMIRKCQNKMLFVIDEMMKEGIIFWLEGKTLLDAWRTGHFLPWETSMTVGMLDKTWEELQGSDFLQRNELKIDNELIVSQKKLERDAIPFKIDVRRWTRKRTSASSSTGTKAKNNILWPLAELNFEERTICVPKETLKMLKNEFGEDWKKVL